MKRRTFIKSVLGAAVGVIGGYFVPGKPWEIGPNPLTRQFAFFQLKMKDMPFILTSEALPWAEEVPDKRWCKWTDKHGTKRVLNYVIDPPAGVLALRAPRDPRQH